MRRKLLVFAAFTLVSAALVAGLGTAMVGAPEERRGVLAGVAIGAGFQLLVFSATVVALPESRIAAFGVGMLARLVLVIAAGLALVPATGLPAAPTLLSMVTVLFATTLVEPVLFAAGARNEKSR